MFFTNKRERDSNSIDIIIADDTRLETDAKATKSDLTIDSLSQLLLLLLLIIK